MSTPQRLAEGITLFVFAELLFYGMYGLVVVRPFPSFLIEHALVLPFFRLSPYGYNIILYSAYAFVLFPRWGPWTLPAFGLVYTTNELVFNALYTLRYPSSVGAPIDANRMWPWYIVLVAAGFAVCLFILKPRLRYSTLTLVFPVFLAVWFAAGMPLMHPYYAQGLGFYPSHFWWELGYQLSLMASFYATVHPRGGAA